MRAVQNMSARRAQSRAEPKMSLPPRLGKDLGPMPLESFITRIKNEAESRRDVAE